MFSPMPFLLKSATEEHKRYMDLLRLQSTQSLGLSPIANSFSCPPFSPLHSYNHQSPLLFDGLKQFANTEASKSNRLEETSRAKVNLSSVFERLDTTDAGAWRGAAAARKLENLQRNAAADGDVTCRHKQLQETAAAVVHHRFKSDDASECGSASTSHDSPVASPNLKRSHRKDFVPRKVRLLESTEAHFSDDDSVFSAHDDDEACRDDFAPIQVQPRTTSESFYDGASPLKSAASFTPTKCSHLADVKGEHVFPGSPFNHYTASSPKMKAKLYARMVAAHDQSRIRAATPEVPEPPPPQSPIKPPIETSALSTPEKQLLSTSTGTYHVTTEQRDHQASVGSGAESSTGSASLVSDSPHVIRAVKQGNYLKLKKEAQLIDGQLLFVCPHCGKVFHRSSNFSRHMRIHRGVYSYFCSKCRRGFYRKEHFDKHKCYRKSMATTWQRKTKVDLDNASPIKTLPNTDAHAQEDVIN